MFIKLRGQQVHVVDFGTGEPAIVGIPGRVRDDGDLGAAVRAPEPSTSRHSYDRFGTANSTLHVIEGSGHVPTLSRPEEVAAIFERLVERSSAVVD